MFLHPHIVPVVSDGDKNSGQGLCVLHSEVTWPWGLNIFISEWKQAPILERVISYFCQEDKHLMPGTQKRDNPQGLINHEKSPCAAGSVTTV